jgi:hypothetical protein
MPWAEIAPHAPALVALILFVIVAGGLFWRVFKKTTDISQGFVKTLTEVSDSCHVNHREVSQETVAAIREASERTASSIERNTQALDHCHTCQREQVDAMKEVTFALKQINGRTSG